MSTLEKPALVSLSNNLLLLRFDVTFELLLRVSLECDNYGDYLHSCTVFHDPLTSVDVYRDDRVRVYMYMSSTKGSLLHLGYSKYEIQAEICSITTPM